jgi:hypothetical protein
MDGLVKLAFSVLIQMAAAEPLSARIARGGAVAALAVLALIAMLGAAACFCAALWIRLIPAVGPIGAPLIIGGILFAVATVLLLAGYVRFHRKHQQPSAVEALAEALKIGDASKLMHDHKAVLLLFAVLTGLTAAHKLKSSARRKGKD